MTKEYYERGFTCGAFDLCHTGHFLMFEEVKRHCSHLIVGLQKDPSIDRPQKNKPIMDFHERHTILRGIRYIDEIWLYETEAELRQFLAENPRSINVRFLDENYRGKHYTGWDLPIPVIYNSRGHTFSTTTLRKRVYRAERIRRMQELERILEQKQQVPFASAAE